MNKLSIEDVISRYNSKIEMQKSTFMPLIPYLHCCICFEKMTALNATISLDGKVCNVCQTCGLNEYKQGMDLIRDLRDRIEKLEKAEEKNKLQQLYFPSCDLKFKVDISVHGMMKINTYCYGRVIQSAFPFTANPIALAEHVEAALNEMVARINGRR